MKESLLPSATNQAFLTLITVKEISICHCVNPPGSERLCNRTTSSVLYEVV